MTSTSPTPRRRDAPSPTMLFVAFGGLLASLAAGYGVLFTIVDDYRNEYGISETAIGVVIGIGFLAAFVSQLVIAPLADRGHARKVVLFGVGINVVGLLLMGFSTTLVPILIGRVISGVGIGAAIPAARRIVILADPQHLGQNLGRLLAAEVFGFAMGPAVSAALVGPFGIPAPFVVVAVVTMVLLPFVAQVTVAEGRPTAHRRLALDLLRIRPFAGAVVLGAAVFVMIGSFDALWALVHDDLGTTNWLANLGITLFALPLIILGPIGGRWAQVYGPFRVATIGLVGGALFMTLYGLMPTGGWIFALAMVHAVSDGFTVSSTGVAVGMTVPEDRQAGAQGVLGGAQALAAGVMAVVTGTLYDEFGRTVAYAVCGVVMLTLVAIGVWLARSAWMLRRPLHVDEPIEPRPAPVAP
ncbi:MAG TPA: MFS transporter [Ilumatobacteraceae bacterium]|nr:MFS transporter [Ilumatobacteraceae bacterium]